MLRTTVYFDEATVLALRHQAGVRHCSQADIIRTAVREYLEQQQPAERPQPPGVGGYRSGRSDVSSQAEALLKQAARRR